MKEVIIHSPKGEQLIHPGDDQSILQAALAGGIKLIHSCLKGQCGSCRAQILDGQVDMRNNFVLFDEEIEQGQILLCQSFPTTEIVRVRPIRQSKH